MAKEKILTVADAIDLLRTQEIQLDTMRATCYKARKALEKQEGFNPSAPSGAPVIPLEAQVKLINRRNKIVFKNQK